MALVTRFLEVIPFWKIVRRRDSRAQERLRNEEHVP